MRTTLHFDRAFAPCLYEGTVKELICRMKYTRAPHLARPLSELMINHIHKHRLDTSYLDMLIPIPLHPAKLRERTFNQAQALAEPLAQALSLPCRPGLLRRGRHTRTQTNLDRLRRSANVEDSFRITDPAAVCNAHILLVDDVYTTGATCSAAARALKEAGARIVHAMTLAH
jgi:ComF family protein